MAREPAGLRGGQPGEVQGGFAVHVAGEQHGLLVGREGWVGGRDLPAAQVDPPRRVVAGQGAGGAGAQVEQEHLS